MQYPFPYKTDDGLIQSSGGGGGGSGVDSFTGDGQVLSNIASTGDVAATLATHNKNLVFASSATTDGVQPTFRALVAADLPGGGGGGTVTEVAASSTIPGIDATVTNPTTDPEVVLSTIDNTESLQFDGQIHDYTPGTSIVFFEDSIIDIIPCVYRLPSTNTNNFAPGQSITFYNYGAIVTQTVEIVAHNDTPLLTLGPGTQSTFIATDSDDPGSWNYDDKNVIFAPGPGSNKKIIISDAGGNPHWDDSYVQNVTGDNVLYTNNQSKGEVTLTQKEYASPNYVLATAQEGVTPAAPTFRYLVNDDLPVVDAVHGGTGHQEYVVGSLLAANTSTSLTEIEPDSNSGGLPLVSNGPEAVPSYEILEVIGGGTGIDEISTGELLVGASGNSFTTLAAGSDNQGLIISSITNAPEWGNVVLSVSASGSDPLYSNSNSTGDVVLSLKATPTPNQFLGTTGGFPSFQAIAPDDLPSEGPPNQTLPEPTLENPTLKGTTTIPSTGAPVLDLPSNITMKMGGTNFYTPGGSGGGSVSFACPVTFTGVGPILFNADIHFNPNINVNFEADMELKSGASMTYDSGAYSEFKSGSQTVFDSGSEVTFNTDALFNSGAEFLFNQDSSATVYMNNSNNGTSGEMMLDLSSNAPVIGAKHLQIGMVNPGDKTSPNGTATTKGAGVVRTISDVDGIDLICEGTSKKIRLGFDTGSTTLFPVILDEDTTNTNIQSLAAGSTSTAMSGNLTLLKTSTTIQIITSYTTGSIILPQSSTCSLGLIFIILNNTASSISLYSYSGGLILTIPPQQSTIVVNSSTTGDNNFAIVSVSGTSGGGGGGAVTSVSGDGILFNNSFSTANVTLSPETASPNSVLSTNGGTAYSFHSVISLAQISTETVLNVKYFGAVGDGVTDDTTAINNAIAAVPYSAGSYGGVVYFPSGQYLITSTISITAKNSLTLRGDGRGTQNGSCILSNAAGGSAFTLVQFNGCQFSGIENMELFSVSYPTTGYAVSITQDGSAGGYQCFVNKVDINGLYNGVYIYNSSETRLDQVTIRGVGGIYGIYIGGTAASPGGSFRAHLNLVSCDLPNAVDEFYPTAPTFANSTAYSVGEYVIAGSIIYQVTTAGTSQSSGSAPTTRQATPFINGTCFLQYIGGAIDWLVIDSYAYSIIIDSCNFIHGMRGVVQIDSAAVSSPPSYPKWIQSFDLECDHNLNENVSLINGSGFQVSNGWFGSTFNGNGISIASTYLGEFLIATSRISGVAQNGILINGGSDVSITNNNIGAVSQLGSGTYHGVITANGVSNFNIVGNNIGADVRSSPSTNMGYGIFIGTGSSNYSYDDNIITNYTTGTISDGSHALTQPLNEISSYGTSNQLIKSSGSGSAPVWSTTSSNVPGVSFSGTTVSNTSNYSAFTADGSNHTFQTGMFLYYIFSGSTAGTSFTLPATNTNSIALGQHLLIYNYTGQNIDVKDNGGTLVRTMLAYTKFDLWAATIGSPGVWQGNYQNLYSDYGPGTSGQTLITSTGGVAAWGTLSTSGGGTNLTSYTQGDLLYYNTGTSLSKLGIGTDGQVLKTAATGLPAWDTLASQVPGTSFTGLTLGNASNYAAFLNDGNTHAFQSGIFLYYIYSGSTAGTIFTLPATNSNNIALGQHILIYNYTSQSVTINDNSNTLVRGLGPYTKFDLWAATIASPGVWQGDYKLIYMDYGVGTSGQALLSNGNGTATWTTLSNSNIPVVDTTHGGTGLSTALASGSLIYGSGSNPVSTLGIGANGQILRINSSVPQWFTPMTNPGEMDISSAYTILNTDPSSLRITASGFVVKLADSSTCVVGQLYTIKSTNTVTVTIQSNSGAGFQTLQPNQAITVVNTSTSGTNNFVLLSESAGRGSGHQMLRMNGTNYLWELPWVVGGFTSVSISGTPQNFTSQDITGQTYFTGSTSTDQVVNLFDPSSVTTQRGVNFQIYNANSGTGSILLKDTTSTTTLYTIPPGYFGFVFPWATTSSTTWACSILPFSGVSGTNPVQKVVTGGTGLTSTTSYGLIAGGTTSTGNLQQVATGTSGKPLLSGGSGALPAFNTLTESGGGTNQTSYTQGQMLYASGTNTLDKLSIGSQYQVLFSPTATVPSWSNGYEQSGTLSFVASTTNPTFSSFSSYVRICQIGNICTMELAVQFTVTPFFEGVGTLQLVSSGAYFPQTGGASQSRMTNCTIRGYPGEIYCIAIDSTHLNLYVGNTPLIPPHGGTPVAWTSASTGTQVLSQDFFAASGPGFNNANDTINLSHAWCLT